MAETKEITYEDMLKQLRKNYESESNAIGVLLEELADAMSAKSMHKVPGIRTSIRTHEKHKILISRALNVAEIMMLSNGS